MKNFKNENVNKEFTKTKNVLYIGLFIIAICFAFICYGALKDENTDAVSFYDMRMNNETGEKKAYIDIATEPVNFAYYEGDPNEFYLVYGYDKEKDETTLYVTKMSKKNYEKLKDASDENQIRATGTTVTVPSDIKKLAIDSLNELMGEGYEFSYSDFNTYFSTMYLDLEKEAMSTNEVIIIVAAMIGVVGVILAIAGFINMKRFQKNIKNLSEEEFSKIEKELEDKDAFYYKSARVYLTKNYIINFNGTFNAIPYKDVIWIYKYEYRQNGIKTQQNIRVMTKDGKTHVVANLAGLTKKAKEVFDEILETIVKNSNNALVGYTKENRQKVKEKIEKVEK